MQDRLSREPRLRARRQTATAASPGSCVRPLESFLAASWATSRFEKVLSDMPSQTSSRKSVESHSNVRRSGVAQTAWRSGGRLSTFLKRASPNARLRARSPLTRGTPSFDSTTEPAFSIRSRSAGSSGLWSYVRAPSLPGPSTIVPLLRHSRTRLSPTFPTRSRHLPFSSAGASVRTKVPVEPPAWSVARNSASNRLHRAAMAPSSAGGPLASSSDNRRAINAEHWWPPWPSKIPKNPQVSWAWMT
mmetsp:Transcript_89866/g.262667  ORF Transcript_89866/g.262667 Transcript_89866/m.262667 type:complete len:246 (+) Transcript_89866:611-1348(+)